MKFIIQSDNSVHIWSHVASYDKFVANNQFVAKAAGNIRLNSNGQLEVYDCPNLKDENGKTNLDIIMEALK